MSFDVDTKNWILTASDEQAAKKGMVMDLETAAHVIEWIESHCRLYEGDKAGELLELLPYQINFVTRLFGWQRYSRRHGTWIRRFRRGGLWAAKKNGKALALDTPIPTLHGWKQMGEIVVGDILFDENGKQTRVLGAFDTMYGHDCYRVYFSDETSIVADAEHLWSGWCNNTYVTATTNDIRTTLNGASFQLPGIFSKFLKLRITHVESVPSVPVRCIAVDSPSHLFLAGEGMVPTHNTPFLAALELYMLIGDGEPGQKVYTAAKDGDQARIAQLQAFKMVEQSPELLDDCQIYRNTLEIVHMPSNSRMKVLSSGSERNKAAKEGLNGSVFWDEMHVVDSSLVARVSRAGISRREPLDVSVSTAGNELVCEGRVRLEYGRQVNSGQRNDLEFLHVEYSGPDDLNEDKFFKDPEKYLKMANPAWGHIIDPDEIMNDAVRSSGDIREFRLFMQYRANVWTTSSTSWLDMSGWMAGRRDYDPVKLGPEFRGRECFAGLDLSRVRDMSAFVLIFPWPEEHPEAYRLWPVFWIPEKTAKYRDRLYPFLSWADKKHLRITPGARIGYDIIKYEIREIVRENDLALREIAYDPYMANELTLQLVEGDIDREGNTVEEGLGCERVEFKQYAAEFTAPTKEFENLVANGLIHHPSNEVLSWQASVAEVHYDLNQYARPIKPETRETGKSIDGVVAAVMALRSALNHRKTKFVYG